MIPTIIIASVIGLAVVCIVFCEIRKKLQGKSSCSCGGNCGACGVCQRENTDKPQ